MKIRFWPKERAGKYAVCLIFLFILLLILKFFSYRIGLPSPVIAVLGVIGFVFGVISMIKYKDRALLTMLAVIIGLLVILWVTAEILFPH